MGPSRYAWLSPWDRHVRKSAQWEKLAVAPKAGSIINLPSCDGQAYLGVAFELPGTILGGLVLGYFLDAYLGTSPWLLLALTALAFVAAFVRLMKWVRFFAKERNGSRGEKDDPEN